jgi:hypothetical protein
MIAPLSRLPTLTRLPCIGQWSVVDPGELLARLPALMELDMCCLTTVDITLCIRALTRSVRLSTLKLGHPELTSDHLDTLLPHLTGLIQLTLKCCPALESLVWATQTRHLASTLHAIWLTECHQLSPIELHHLRALTSLRLLIIRNSFTTEFDAFTVASFTPGSPVFQANHFPHLTEFVYITPAAEEEVDEEAEDEHAGEDEEDEGAGDEVNGEADEEADEDAAEQGDQQADEEPADEEIEEEGEDEEMADGVN